MSCDASLSLRDYHDCKNPPNTTNSGNTTTTTTTTMVNMILQELDYHHYVAIVFLVCPVLYLLDYWNKNTGSKLETATRAVRLGCYISLGLYFISNYDSDYMRAFIDHLGHPPLYGISAPMANFMFYWLMCGVVDLVCAVITAYGASSREQLWLTHWCLFERYITVVIIKNPTCLIRILSDIIVNIISLSFFIVRVESSIKRKACHFIFRSLLGTCIVVGHMIAYLVLRGNGVMYPSQAQASTTGWFQVPNSYFHFAIWQLVVSVVQWIQYAAIVNISISSSTTTVTEQIEGEKQD